MKLKEWFLEKRSKRAWKKTDWATIWRNKYFSLMEDAKQLHHMDTMEVDRLKNENAELQSRIDTLTAMMREEEYYE